MKFIHDRRSRVNDEEHASLLIGYVPYNQVLEGQHCWFVLDHRRDKGEGVRSEKVRG